MACAELNSAPPPPPAATTFAFPSVGFLFYDCTVEPVNCNVMVYTVDSTFAFCKLSTYPTFYLSTDNQPSTKEKYKS